MVHQLRPADRPAQYRLVQDEPQFHRIRAQQRFLPLNAQAYQPLDLVRRQLPVDRGRHRASVFLGLQQAMDYQGLVGT
jgi:hypothetical protein